MDDPPVPVGDEASLMLVVGGVKVVVRDLGHAPHVEDHEVLAVDALAAWLAQR